MDKTRVIVLTDICSLRAEVGEADDAQSLIRFLLYANQFEIEAIVATYSKHLQRPEPKYVTEILSGYEKSRNYLLEVDEAFPSGDALKQKVFAGLAHIGEDHIFDHGGAGRDIINAVDNDESIVWILAWGGVLDLAQALHIAESEKSEREFEIFLSKIRVYSINDQYDTCGDFVRNRYSNLFYITAYHAYRGLYRGGDRSSVNSFWVEQNIKSKGELGKLYPNYVRGDIYARFLGEAPGVKEGDTPSFLYLVNNGLSDPQKPEWGGWGGRFAQKHGTNHYFDCCDFWQGDCSEWASVRRFRERFQQDFAARINWSSGQNQNSSYPKFEIAYDKTILPGKIYSFSCKINNPENYEFHWWYYPDPGDYRGVFLMKNQDTSAIEIMVPNKTRSSGEVHLIVEVSTKGSDILTSYKRLILEVKRE